MHERRARSSCKLIAERPLTAYELAQALWGNVAVTQAYLTLSEVLGHTDLLIDDGQRRRGRGRVRRRALRGGLTALGDAAQLDARAQAAELAVLELQAPAVA